MGSRTGVQKDAVVRFVEFLNPVNTVVISGGAAGVDTWAAEAARERGIRVVEIRPNYMKYGKAATWHRNTEIIAAAHDVAAFWNMESNGTLDSIRKGIRYRKQTAVFNGEGTLIEYFDPTTMKSMAIIKTGKRNRNRR